MLEDAPQHPLQENEQQQSAPESQMAAEVIGGVAVNKEPTKIDVQDSEPVPSNDTRWDETKALTVGMAAKESDTMDSDFRRQITGPIDHNDMPLDDRAFDNKDLTSERVWRNRPDIADKLISAEQEMRNLGDADQEVLKEAREKLRQAQKEYDAAVPESYRLTNEYTEQSAGNREKVIEKLTSSFEELYEMNPELFAKMPTAEFIEARKELLGIEHELGNSSEGLENITTILDKLQKMIDDKRQISYGNHQYYYQGPNVTSRTIIATVGVALGSLDKNDQGVERLPQNDGLYEYGDAFDVTSDHEDSKEFYDIRHKYIEEVYSDDNGFDKTPRQILEDYKRITTEYLEQARTNLTEAERRKQEFMAKYAKNSKTSPPAESAS